MPLRKRAATVPILSAEVGEAELGDARLTRRLGQLIDSLWDRPGESFPKALDDAELEAADRFRITLDGAVATVEQREACVAEALLGLGDRPDVGQSVARLDVALHLRVLRESAHAL